MWLEALLALCTVYESIITERAICNNIVKDVILLNFFNSNIQWKHYAFPENNHILFRLDEESQYLQLNYIRPPNTIAWKTDYLGIKSAIFEQNYLNIQFNNTYSEIFDANIAPTEIEDEISMEIDMMQRSTIRCDVNMEKCGPFQKEDFPSDLSEFRNQICAFHICARDRICTEELENCMATKLDENAFQRIISCISEDIGRHIVLEPYSDHGFSSMEKALACNSHWNL